MKNFSYLLLGLLFFSCANESLQEEIDNISYQDISSKAGTIRVSAQSGNSVQKFREAINKASSGDTVLLDVDVNMTNNDGAVTINKSITLKGADRGNVKYVIKRSLKQRAILIVTSSDVSIENITFVNGDRQLLFSTDQTVRNSAVTNCNFKGSGYTGIDFRGKFVNSKITNSYFENCRFGLQTYDCPVLDGFLADKLIFRGGDHQLSLDNPNATISKHQNITISNSRFFIAKRFNIALANTRNITIFNNIMDGGTDNYSQGLHIEDRTSNVSIIKNTIKCIKDVAVLVYSTDKFGHGQGNQLTEQQKRDYGSRNITLDNNVIESGNSDYAIKIVYGKGLFKVFGNNIVKSGNRGLDAFKSKDNGMSFQINDNATIKDRKYKDIKTESNNSVRESYVRIR